MSPNRPSSNHCVMALLLLVQACAPAAAPASTPVQEAPAQEARKHGGFSLVQLLRNGRAPAAGLVTGGQPTPEALELAKTEGIATVINLRTEAEMTFDEKALVEGLGMNYVSIPVAGVEGLTEANVQALDRALQGAGPALVHCGSGNRVGALFALRARALQGAPADVALQVGLDHGLSGLRSVVEQRLSEPAP